MTDDKEGEQKPKPKIVIEARVDGTTCPACRVVVPLGQYCGCLMKWRG